MNAAEIEATNRVRKSVGLPLLPVPGQQQPSVSFKEHSSSEDSDEDPISNLESREAAAYGNYQKVQDEAAARKRREAKAAAIKKARDSAARFSVLQGKGLGDVSDEDLDAKSWLKSSSKRQKQIDHSRKLKDGEEQAEKERLAKIVYDEKSLKGIQVAHEVGEFEADGSEQIMTLVDRKIGNENDDEEDELEVAELREAETQRQRNQLKKKQPVYDPNAHEEEGEHGILSQYDETITDGKSKRKAFHLDGQGATVEERDPKRQSTDADRRARIISLDFLKPEQTISDYMDISEIKIRKPKNKKKKTRQKVADEGEDDLFPSTQPESTNEPAMDIDGELPAVLKPREPASSFLDDDYDLAASLALQRKQAIKKKRKLGPDLVKQIQEAAAEEEGNDSETGGLIIDETSEFVSNFHKRDPLERKATKLSSDSPIAAPSDDEDEDATMEDERPTSPLEQANATPGMTTTGLEDEANVDDQGLARTLEMLRKRNLVKSDDSADLNELDRERQRFLAEKKRRETEAEQRARNMRENDRKSGKLDKLSNKEKEDYAAQQNVYRQNQDGRLQAEIFNREYRPQVDLRYKDENGRSLTQKVRIPFSHDPIQSFLQAANPLILQEAFRELSHQFHGKGSGANKTSKYLKKVDDEKRREAKSTLDASQATGMNNAMGTSQKKNKTAGVRLS